VKIAEARLMDYLNHLVASIHLVTREIGSFSWEAIINLIETFFSQKNYIVGSESQQLDDAHWILIACQGIGRDGFHAVARWTVLSNCETT
jgi:hypothetical protein